MKALIVENELYLAQSISNKLSAVGFYCEIVSEISQIKASSHFDAVLLSTNVANFEQIIPHFKQSVIILLVSYISVDTVTEPMGAGASDYIQKPFMVEELLRKITLHQRFKRLEKIENSYKNFISNYAQRANLGEFEYKKLKLPVILQANKQINADAFAFGYIFSRQSAFNYIDIKPTTSANAVFKASSEVLYLSNFQNLAPAEAAIFWEGLGKKQIIIHSKTPIKSHLQVIELDNKNKELYDGDILTIEEYVRFIIEAHQNEFADTELAHKLGISRKSLWDRRKKYGLSKKR